MNLRKPRVPWVLEVQGRRYAFCNQPWVWTETVHRELVCDVCRRPLVILYAGRNISGVDRYNPRWWIPTGARCGCPREAAVREVPRYRRQRRKDSRQLEINFTPPHTAELFPNERYH